MKAKSNILIISDMCGYGKVSAAVQMPILSYMGLDVFNLPTMLISNTFPYGKYAILECTSYIEEALQKWNELGIHFDAITTGFMASERQAKLVAITCHYFLYDAKAIVIAEFYLFAHIILSSVFSSIVGAFTTSSVSFLLSAVPASTVFSIIPSLRWMVRSVMAARPSS